MDKKLLLGVTPVIAVMLLATVGTVFAEKPSTSGFEWSQFYDGWGPANYYEQKVLVRYTSINRWVLNKEPSGIGWNIEQALTQRGTAEVYDATQGSPFTDSWGVSGLKGALIEDGLKFHVVETTKGYVTNDRTWYHRDDVATLQDWNYHWIINKVYHYFASYHDGQWSSRILYP